MMKPKFTRATVNAYTQKRADIIQKLLIRHLIFLGEECVNICREKHGYMDQTGNLTSSIGYELFVNGKPYHENFKATPGSESGDEGVNKGRALALEIGALGNYTLVLVAGMEYAEEVEARGKDVLTPGYLHMEQELPKIKLQILRELKQAG